MATTTKYKTYPKYKPSGSDWLGNVPDGWETKRLRFLMTLQKGKKPDETSESVDGLPYLTMDFLRGQEEPTKYVPAPESVVVNDGDILLLWDGANAGEFVKGVKGILSSTMAEVSFGQREVDSRYRRYFLESFEKKLRELTIGMGIPHVSGDIVKDCITPIPTDLEQKTIADFLDRETAKIDDVVGKKQKLIELLKEERQAIITHAVTKGLDPKAKMKPSGIDWLGNIPTQWGVKDLKYLLERNDGGVWGEDFDDEGTPVLRSTEIDVDGNWKLDEFAKRKLTLEEKQKALLKEGDLLITKSSGSELHIGKTALVTKEIEDLECCFSNFMQRLRPLKHVSSKLLFYFFNSYIAREQYNYFSQSTTGLANLSGDLFGQIIFVKIPEIEQRAIVSFLDRETAKIDDMIKKNEAQIEKLQEYRQALITSAVTGKIMVS